jgi:hypothetical protein
MAGGAERSMRKSGFPGILAWMAALAVHAGVAYLVAPIF